MYLQITRKKGSVKRPLTVVKGHIYTCMLHLGVYDMVSHTFTVTENKPVNFNNYTQQNSVCKPQLFY